MYLHVWQCLPIAYRRASLNAISGDRIVAMCVASSLYSITSSKDPLGVHYRSLHLYHALDQPDLAIIVVEPKCFRLGTRVRVVSLSYGLPM